MSARGKLLCWLLSAIPVYVLVGLIQRHGVNVPYWDEWNWSVSRYLAGDLTEFRMGPFWALRNEHRLFLPQLFGTALAHATDLNMFAHLYAKLALCCVIFVLLVHTYTRRAQAPGAHLIALVFSVLVFSVVQWPRWIDPRPLPTTFALLGTVACVSVLCGGPPTRWRFALAAVACYFASLSYFSGNLTWIVGGVLLALTGYRGVRAYALWIVLTLTVWVPYAIDFWGSESLARTAGPPTLEQLGRFVLVFLGSPLVGTERFAVDQTPALAFGAAGLGLCVLAALLAPRWVAEGWRKCLPWLALAAWVGASAVAAGYGRSSLGHGAARLERYTVYGTFFWIAVVALMAVLLCEPRRKDRKGVLFDVLFLRLCPGLLAIGTAAGYVQASLSATETPNFQRLPRLLTKGRDCLLTHASADDACLNLLYRKPKVLRGMLPKLLARRASFLFPPTQLDFRRAHLRGSGAAHPRRRELRLDGTDYLVLEVTPPGSVFWTELHLPQVGEIQLHTALRVEPAQDMPEAQVQFRVEVQHLGETAELFSAEHSPKPAGHFTEGATIDLSEYAGQVIDLKFTNTGASSETRALWWYPVITYDGKQPW